MRTPLTTFGCKVCHWKQEHRGDIPKRCPRCRRARSLHPISTEAFIAMMDAGDVRYCKPCDIIHTR